MNSTTRNMQIVVKVSKFCNLRCKYCYEYPELGNRAAMSRAQLLTMYRNLRDHFQAADERDGARTALDFIWHGGEPLMQPAQFYRQTLADQREIFGAAIATSNSVQTNLTVLDDERRQLLADGFDSVGVSLDVAGGLRVNLAGRDSQQRVAANLDALVATGVPVGCISVLTAQNIHAVERVFRFFEARNLNFRVLPLFDTGEPGQTTPFEVSTEQELAALARLVQLWLAGDTLQRPPAPLDDYVRIAARYLAGEHGPRYRDRREWLPVMLVDTDGSCYTYGEPYGDRAWSIGNVFTEPFADLLAGPVFERCAVEAERRVARNCLSCPFFDACGGALVAETEARERDEDGHGTLLCTGRPMITYIVDQLRDRVPHTVARWRATA
ncbi:radical SAM protein [Nocardia sp. alder85J]|uniref:radical SAM protein n=1 Tax=Nocardia sp. alder85J TaxID=2862949 RepID=UPI001CD356B2|nr:radical SAM protein [Nocardia sp. alder85J]MCX4098521.1 radical SAM protein [Nocardia sp. alder85J]